MQRYSKYRPTGIDWIGEIPSHWDVMKYRRLFSVSSGDFLAPEIASTDETEFPVYGGNGIRGYANDFNNEGPMLLIGRVGARCGNIHLAENRFWVSEHALRVLPKREFDLRYFRYLLELTNFNQFAITTAQPLINSEIVLDRYAAVPPGKEQTAIASFLEEKTTAIDKLISNKQKLIELLKEERIAIINEAVSDKGKNWVRKKLRYVVKKVQTGSTPPSNEDRYYGDEINWFTPSDFSENLWLRNSKRKIAHLSITDGVVKIFPENSVLFVGIGATLGKVGYILEPATSNQQINCLVFHNEVEAIFYANYFYSNQPNIAARANAATLAILNQSQMKDIILPVPSSLDELKEAVQHIETEAQRIDSAISKIDREIDLLNEYRTALISEVVTGKIKVV